MMAVNISSAAVRTKAAGRAAAIIIQDKAKDREEVKARGKEEVKARVKEEVRDRARAADAEDWAKSACTKTNQ